MTRKKKILIGILIAVVLIITGLFFYIQSNYNHNEINKDNLGIDEEFNGNTISHEVDTGDTIKKVAVNVSGIRNIALFGLDRRTSAEKTTRSDSIMVLTVNYDTEEIKLTSFMRDMLVGIEGKGYDKLNHSYSYGGPELAIKTLNQNFGLNIEDYVAVDFLMLEEIINKIGGVQVEVEYEEVDLINQYMNEIAVKNNKSYNKLEKSGNVILDGAQAVAFSRIRYHGDGDYERTERQRIVLSAMIEKLSKVNILDIPSLATTIMKNTETSISQFEAIQLANDYLSLDFSSPQTSRIPRDGSFTTGINKSGMWVMNVDFEKEKQYLRDWIFNSNATENKDLALDQHLNN